MIGGQEELRPGLREKCPGDEDEDEGGVGGGVETRTCSSSGEGKVGTISH